MQLPTAGDLACADFQFLSSRKAARAERYTPKPSAAGLDRKLKLATVFFNPLNPLIASPIFPLWF
jgi:hypothetical protein